RADVALNQISPTLLPALESERELSISSRPGANLAYLVVRHQRGPLANSAVRRAVSLAVDRGEITRTLFGGHAVPARGLVPISHWAHAPGSEPFPFDPLRAKKDLDAAGFPDPEGPAPRFTLTLLTSTNRVRLTVARTIAQELEDVGIA